MVSAHIANVRNGQSILVRAHETSVPGLVAYREKRGSDWRLYHKPSGYFAFGGFKYLAGAKEAARRLGEILPNWDCPKERVIDAVAPHVENRKHVVLFADIPKT